MQPGSTCGDTMLFGIQFTSSVTIIGLAVCDTVCLLWNCVFVCVTKQTIDKLRLVIERNATPVLLALAII